VEHAAVMLGPGQRALAVGAHPDDCEFGCYGTLQRFEDRSVLVLSAGELGGPPEQRRREAAEAAGCIDAKLTLADQPDTALSVGAAIEAVREALAELRPDVVFCPCRTDEHQDHAVVARASQVATRGFQGAVLAYLTPSAVSGFSPQLIVALDEPEWRAKAQALAAHRSQRRRSYLSADYLHTTAHYWALQAGGGARWAEPFEVVRWVEPSGRGGVAG
jgi:LmbE family N-acetylglucosaminyl deacetylase